LFHLSQRLHKFVKLVTITTTVNLKLKLDYLSSHKKIKIFQRHVLSKAFCRSSKVRMRTNAFREEAIADHKTEEY